MKQLNITLLLTLLMSMVGAKALAYDAKINGIYYDFSGTNAIVTCYSSNSTSNKNAYTGSVVIPETVTYNGITYPVTSIGDYAFSGCSGLTSVDIPNSVTNIGNAAFSNCSNLTSVTIPNSVTSIGGSAFSGTWIYANSPDGVFYVDNWVCGYKGEERQNELTIAEGTRGICAGAFSWCSGLTSVNIPNSVTSIGEAAFAYCSGLTSVIIPNSVTSVGGSAFSGCSNLTSATIGNSVNSIGDEAFFNCYRLSSVTIGNSVTSIGNNAFSECSSLTNVKVPVTDYSSFCGNIIVGLIASAIHEPVHLIDEVGNEITEFVIPNEVTSIGSKAFYKCSSLTSVTIPNSVTSISNYAFSGCSSLTRVTIPNSVTSIGNYAFSGCSGLQSVVVGNGVTSLPDYVFGTGNNLNSLTIGSGVLSISSNAFRKNYDSSASKPVKTIWLTNTPPNGYGYAAGTMKNYVANNLYTNLDNKTEYPFLSSLFEVDGVKYVPVSPSERTCDAIDCLYDESATNINIGETVLYKGVEMTVQGVRQYTCYSNTYINNVKLNFNGDVESNAFQGCTGLTFAQLRNKGFIGASALQGCKAMTSATLGEAVTGISGYAFDGCSSLQSIVIPNAVTNIGQYAFSNCPQMVSVKIGTAVQTIGKSAFSGCSSLPNIEIPQSVTNIQDNAFQGCTSLKNVVMANRSTILSLGSNGFSPLFSSCPLDSVYIGGNISYNTGSNYGYSPFYRNTSLRTVVITDKETEISENEFYGCTNLQDVKIGDGVESFGNWAFSGCSSLKHLSFGTNVAKIGKEAFSDCASVTQIVSRAQQPPVCDSQALDDINKWECTLMVPAESMNAYRAADQWKEFFFMEEYDTGVARIASETQEGAKYYSPEGKPLDRPQRGLNIVVMQNGTVRKVFVK